jgi:Protein of unknown function (DUF3422)
MGKLTDFANERPAFPLHHPAITRDLVFRLPKEHNPRSYSRSDERRRVNWIRLIRAIARYIGYQKANHLLKGASLREKVAILQSDIETITKNSSRSIVFQICDVDQHESKYRLRIRVDIYNEIFSITQLYDKFDHDSFINVLDVDSVGNSRSQFIENIDDFKKNLPLHEDDRFDQLHLAPTIVESKSFVELGAELVADFRGVVLGTRKWDSSPPPARRNYEPPSTGTLSLGMQQFYNSNKNLFSAFATRSRGGADIAKGSEAVVCGMLGGQAIYACELAQWESNPPKLQPVFFLVVYDGDSAYQLGRLVRRLHVLGELRHTALLDYADTAETGKSVRDASREIRLLTSKVNSLLEASSSDLAVSGDAKRAPSLYDDCLNAVGELAKINAYCEGGLNYRVEQSRYYAAEFRSSLRDMKLVKINYYQTYEEFVSRYIFKLFDRIDRVGNRLDYLEKRVNSLMELHQSRLMRQYQDDVTHTLFGLRQAVNSMATAAGDMSGTTKKQYHTLLTAEWFAVAFLVYYFFSVIEKSYEIESPFGFFLNYTKPAMKITAIILMCYFSYLALNELWKGIKERRNQVRQMELESTLVVDETSS